MTCNHLPESERVWMLRVEKLLGAILWLFLVAAWGAGVWEAI